MNENFGTNKAAVEIIEESAFREMYLEIFILVLIVNGTMELHSEGNGENLMS